MADIGHDRLRQIAHMLQEETPVGVEVACSIMGPSVPAPAPQPTTALDTLRSRLASVLCYAPDVTDEQIVATVRKLYSDERVQEKQREIDDLKQKHAWVCDRANRQEATIGQLNRELADECEMCKSLAIMVERMRRAKR